MDCLSIQPHLPKSCYHVKNHGGLKKAVQQTHKALPDYQYVFRSDVKSYYESVDFNILFTIIETYVHHPILVKLVVKSCYRTETRGGNFYDYFEKGIPMGSPLSPLLGAIALIPLDQAMEKTKGIFYARFMDDWLVLTHSKTALRKVIKLTHKIMQNLKFQLHPAKTYVGKISHGFNFLAYYMDDQKILPSCETLRRFFERAAALYEPSPSQKPKKYKRHNRDVSWYQVNEPAPTEQSFQRDLKTCTERARKTPDILVRLRKYLKQWACWLKCGLSEILEFENCVLSEVPSLYACWNRYHPENPPH